MKRISVILLFLLFLSTVSVMADMGPKPSMYFYLEFEGDAQQQFVQLIQLQYNYATDATPADSLHQKTHKGPQGLAPISLTEWKSVAYGYTQFQKLMVVFKNDTVYSDMFTKEAFNSVYRVKISDTSIQVENRTPWFVRDDNPYAYFRSLFLTLFIELGALWVVLLIFRYPDKKRFMLATLIANLVSLFVFWYGIMGVLNSLLGFFIGEIFVVLFETFFIWYFTRKAASFGKTLLLVVFLNFLSMMAGGAFLFFNTQFGQQINHWFV